MRKLGWKPVGTLAILAIVLLAQPASAQVNHSGVLDNVLSRFQAASSSWGPYFVSRAQFLFFGLALISMVWTFGAMALRQADLGSILSELIRFVIFVGLFSFFLTNGPAIAGAIIDSMVQMGSAVSGFPEAFTPSHALNIGFQILDKVAAKSTIWHPVDAMAGILVAIVLLIVLAMTMINVLLVQISLWIVAYAGIFILGFGGSRWTSDMAINYFKSVFGIALSLMGMILVIGVGLKILDDFYAQAGANTLQDDVAMLVIGVCLFVLSNKIPALLVGMVTGASVGGASGIAMATAGNVATAAIAAATAGAGAAAAGATQAAGGASAIKAAFDGAQTNMANGTGMFSGMGGGAGEAGGGGSGDGGGSGGGGGGSGGGGSMYSPLSSAMGNPPPANDNPGAGSGAATGAGSGQESASAGGGDVPNGSAGGAVGEPNAAAAGSAEEVVAATAEAGSAATAGGGGAGGGGTGGGRAGGAGTGGGGGGGAGGGQPGRLATAGLFAADMASNLGGGIARSASNKLADLTDKAKEAIGQTAGGRLASEIRNPGAAASERSDRAAVAAAGAIQARESLASDAGSAREFLAGRSGDSLAPAAGTDNAPSFAGDAISSSGFAGDSLPSGPGQAQQLSAADAGDEVADFVRRSANDAG